MKTGNHIYHPVREMHLFAYTMSVFGIYKLPQGIGNPALNPEIEETCYPPSAPEGKTSNPQIFILIPAKLMAYDPAPVLRFSLHI